MAVHIQHEVVWVVGSRSFGSAVDHFKEHLPSFFRVRYGGRIFLWQVWKQQSDYMISQRQRWPA